ncbi:MAG: hypothetical protein SFV15_15070 [Polyangiaceae bacterium]|nr:hypothetical protein [Polyangiaceae bacterium]
MTSISRFSESARRRVVFSAVGEREDTCEACTLGHLPHGMLSA